MTVRSGCDHDLLLFRFRLSANHDLPVTVGSARAGLVLMAAGIPVSTQCAFKLKATGE
jgi:hypothetical protein